MVPSDAITTPLINSSSGKLGTLWKLRFTIFLLGTHLFMLSMFLLYGWFTYSPYGRVHPKDAVGIWQIASAPLFVHNSKNWLLSVLVHPIAMIISCFEFKTTSGQLTTVTCFSIMKLLRGLQSFVVLGGLEYLFHSTFQYRQKFTFAGLFVGLSFATFLLRTGLGLASFHVGRGLLPNLSFSDGMRQVSIGFYHVLIPLYFLVYRLTNGQHSGKVFGYNPFTVLLVCLMIPFNTSIWWNVSGLVIGLGLFATSQQVNRIPKIGASQEFDDEERTEWKKISIKSAVLLGVFAFSYWMSQPRRLTGYQEVTCFGKSSGPLVTFVIMSAPRVNEARNLMKTVATYLDALPSDPRNPLHSRVKMIVFTHFTEHKIFDLTRAKYANNPKAQHYLRFVRLDGSDFNQKKHLDAAIRLVAESLEPQSHYIGIIEDDFPICPGKLSEVFRVVRDANSLVPDHCGVFVATGGSGLLLRTSIYQQALAAMEVHPFADIGLQDCLRGKTCKGCQVVIPSTLLMYHTGHDSSTMGNSYRRNVHQCGDRHPLVADMDVVVA